MNTSFKQRGGTVRRLPLIAFAVIWIGLGLTNCVSSEPSHVEVSSEQPVSDSGELNEGACELSWSLCWKRI